ncbi:hypothetical protein [Burkholderia sp. Bp9143]|uniref:hypothetical protein n=1 Tax=Burkholderia sp. Bp9143 TaxID=2184574 RepID=UPI003908AE4C
MQAEPGMPVADPARQPRVSGQPSCRWKQQYAGLASNQVRGLKHLPGENQRLKTAPTSSPPDETATPDATT